MKHLKMFRMEYEIAFVITDPSTTEQEMQTRMEMTEGSNIIISEMAIYCSNNLP